jgi:hypothetical protein
MDRPTHNVEWNTGGVPSKRDWETLHNLLGEDSEYMDYLEAELRRCRAEALREAMKLVRRRNDEGMDMYVESDLSRMAEEAESET